MNGSVTCARSGTSGGPRSVPIRILRRFANWHVLPRLRARAENRPIGPVGRRYAGEQILQATALLTWLAGRGRQLADCTQADVDTWAVEHANSNRVNIRAFLQWSAKTRLTRRFALPTPHSRGTAPMPERDRTALLGKVLTSQEAPLRSRAAAAILLLYARPLSRITRLAIDDIVRDGDQVLLRLGNPPSPVPEPVAALLLEYPTPCPHSATTTTPPPATPPKPAPPGPDTRPATVASSCPWDLPLADMDGAGGPLVDATVWPRS